MSADGGNPSAPQPGASTAGIAPATPPPGGGPGSPKPKPRRNIRRYLLMAAVPVVLIGVGVYFWLSGGRYVSTDNAYVQQDMVTITAQVAGVISEVDVATNQTVKKGDVLFRIDPEPYKIALAQANAALASARLQVDQLRATYQVSLSALKAAQDNNDYQSKRLQRQKDLLAKGVSTQADFDQAENDAHSAQQALTQAQESVSSALSALGGDPTIATDKHPLVLAALAKRDQAALDLKNTTVVAPADGIVAKAGSLEVGGYVTNPSAMPTAVLSLVETGTTWIDANFKETELTDMRPGDKATVSIDAYPGKTFQATVASIGAGTGSEFSLLPAQNATGNWVKVVQRLPVRIHLDTTTDVPMRLGLSAYVTVDTQSQPNHAAAK